MRKNGFTLLELLIGISLISIVMIFLFKLITDIQNESLSNVYIVSNQTKRNEIISITNGIIEDNGDVCSLIVNQGPDQVKYEMYFCNNKMMEITVSSSTFHIGFESKEYNYVMSDTAAYYDTIKNYDTFSFEDQEFLVIDVVTHRKGLKETTVDDVEIMCKTRNASISVITNNIAEFFTGRPNFFVARKAGVYKLEAWGAQGAAESDSFRGGYGAYATGEVYLNVGDVLHINVGGQGTTGNPSSGGYNGGAPSKSVTGTGGGGGATSISKKEGLLSSLENDKDKVLMVAAGGGGYTHRGSTGIGYNGGGIVGNGGSYYAGTQTGSGSGSAIKGTFGQGASYLSTGHAAGGGGGWYGGSTGNDAHGGGGGSSYIGNPLLVTKAMYCYDCTESSETATLTHSNQCANDTPTVECSKKGNGYAKITYIGATKDFSITYNLDGGTLSSSNPSTYNQNDTFTLNNPTKEGYRFVGWSLNDSETIIKNTNVPLGTVGNLVFTAHYTDKYAVTYDYNISSLTFAQSGFLDSGFTPNWDYDFTIELIGNFPTSGKRYLVFGNYNKSKQINIEITTGNKIRIYQSAEKALSSNSIEFNTDLDYLCTWKKSTMTFSCAAEGATSTASASGTLTATGVSGDSLRLGWDYRGSGSTFTPYTLKKLVITRYYPFDTLPTDMPATITKPNQTFVGWYTEQTGGSQVDATVSTNNEDVTYYAHWE